MSSASRSSPLGKAAATTATTTTATTAAAPATSSSSQQQALVLRPRSHHSSSGRASSDAQSLVGSLMSGSAGSLTSASLMPGATAPPSHHKHENSPSELFRKRYQLFDAITEETRLVFGTDIKRPDGRIMLLVYTSEEEYTAHAECYTRLRSKFVSNMVDKFHEAEIGRWFIVVERGGLTLEEYLSTKQELSLEERKVILGEVAQCWVHLYTLNYFMEMKTWSFVQFGKHWKLFDMTFVYRGRSDPHNSLFCAKPLAYAVMEGNHSILLPDQDLEYEHTLGSCLLEFLLLSPLFEGKTIEDVYELVSIEDLVQRVHSLPGATADDAHTLHLVKKILTVPDQVDDKTEDLAVAAGVLANYLQQMSSDRSSVGGVPPIHTKQAFRFLPTGI